MKIPLAVLCPLLVWGCHPEHPPGGGSSPADASAEPAASALPTPDSFVGLTLEAASERAEKADLPHRVVKKDGESLPVTRDYRPERLNFVVEKGLVTKVTNG